MIDDTTTLYIAAFAFGSLPVLTWWLTSELDQDPSTIWWQWGSVAMTVGMSLLMFRTWLPIWLGNLVANTLLLVTLIMWTQSMWVNLQRGWPHRHVIWSCVLAWAYYCATYWLLDAAERIPLNRAVMGTMSLYIAWLAWQLSVREQSRNARGIMACFMVLGIGLWFTAWVVLRTTIEYNAYGVIQKIPGSPALLALFCAMVANFFFVGILLERSTARKARAWKAQAVADENVRLDSQLQQMGLNRRMVLVSGAFAHELTQPLTAALTQTEIALKLANRPNLPVQALNDALFKASWGVTRTQDILERIRNAAHAQMPELARIDLRDVVTTACDMFNTELCDNPVELKLSLPHAPLFALGDAVQLSQVMDNLLRNAERAAATGLHKHIDIKVFGLGAEVVITVQDSGPGVPPQVLQRLGEPFLGTHDQGLGLGLAICMAIVAQHQGKLTLRNLPQGGAQAKLTLPAVPGRAA